MTEPIRAAFLDAVRDVIVAALDVTYPWGNFPAGKTVDRRALDLLRLGDRLRVLVLDDDGSQTPTPDTHDGDLDDRFNFLVTIQVNDAAGPSLWGHRGLDAVKRALAEGTQVDGALWPYTKQRIAFEAEAVVLPTDHDGRFGVFILPCTARLPDNLGGFI
jgi:hypothetical protein